MKNRKGLFLLLAAMSMHVATARLNAIEMPPMIIMDAPKTIQDPFAGLMTETRAVQYTAQITDLPICWIQGTIGLHIMDASKNVVHRSEVKVRDFLVQSGGFTQSDMPLMNPPLPPGRYKVSVIVSLNQTATEFGQLPKFFIGSHSIERDFDGKPVSLLFPIKAVESKLE